MGTVEGRIFSEYDLPANSIAVRVYNRGFGETCTMLGECNTDDLPIIGYIG